MSGLHGEVPFTYDHYRRQQERWAAGSARSFREFVWQIIKSKKLGLIEKLSAIRQNAYFTTTLLTGAAILTGIITVTWLLLGWNTYSVEYYLYVLGIIKVPFITLVYLCVLSNFVEPLIMILVKKRDSRGILHLPMMIWYAWSVLPTYIIGNIKGLFGLELDWFRTPKFVRTQAICTTTMPVSVRVLNLCVCVTILCFYFSEGLFFGWFDGFVLILLPAFMLASIK